MSAAPKVAVIDIGSNSIKVLVARRGTNCGLVKPVFQQTCDARISTGINQCEPRLSPDGMTAGLGAIRDLLLAAASYSPAKIQLVATSAVRDALNRDEFLAFARCRFVVHGLSDRCLVLQIVRGVSQGTGFPC